MFYTILLIQGVVELDTLSAQASPLWANLLGGIFVIGAVITIFFQIRKEFKGMATTEYVQEKIKKLEDAQSKIKAEGVTAVHFAKKASKAYTDAQIDHIKESTDAQIDHIKESNEEMRTLIELQINTLKSDINVFKKDSASDFKNLQGHIDNRFDDMIRLMGVKK